eukprot:TRINITY_DN37915_c0_g3_i2.p1 TRINITY_DN37915_c0_g3~~TRINITY_DN37915_c0_g3_i2.p1  ORF type:complete len:183 (-),score=25.59 TRINITY_DN37915_c0_g3_i2:84-632(-)
MQIYSKWAPTGYDVFSAATADAGAGLQVLAVAEALQKHTRVFCYVFGARSLSPALQAFGSMHLLELSYILNDTNLFDDHSMTSSELQLADRMVDMWTSFAKHGSPTAPESAQGGWPAFGARRSWYMIGHPDSVALPMFRNDAYSFFAEWQGIDIGSQDSPTLLEGTRTRELPSKADMTTIFL